MKTDQRGFGVVEGFIVIVVVGLIGGAGWYVWRMNTNDPTQPNPMMTQSTTHQTT